MDAISRILDIIEASDFEEIVVIGISSEGDVETHTTLAPIDLLHLLEVSAAEYRRELLEDFLGRNRPN